MKSISLVLAAAGIAVCVGCAQQAALHQSAVAARTAASQGDYKAAAEDLTPEVDANSQDPQAYMARASDYFQAGENHRAIADVTRAHELEPAAAYFLLARSVGYSRTGQFDLALDDTDSAIRLAPNTALCYSQRGFVYMAMGDDQNAIKDLLHAIKLNPNSAVYRVQLGFARGMAGDYAGAERAWETAIRIRPDYGPSYSGLGWLQATCPDAKFRDAKKAVENARRGAELGAPTMLTTLVAMGALQTNIQPKPDRNEPTLAWSLDALAAAYANAGDFQRAIAAQQQAIAHNKVPPNPLAVQEQKLLALYQQRKPYRAGFNSVVPALPWIVLPS